MTPDEINDLIRERIECELGRPTSEEKRAQHDAIFFEVCDILSEEANADDVRNVVRELCNR